jgi:protein phosphatase
LSKVRILTAAATDVGRKRSGNEDSYAVWSAEAVGGTHPADRLLVVCDGMGGTAAGEVASRMAVDAIVQSFEASRADDPAVALSDAVHAANDAIWDHVQARPDLKGMGTTCTAIALRGDEVTIGHVGDSRAYLVRGREITQLTQDHSLVAQLVARGELTAERAKHDPRRNVVTRSVGVGAEVEVDIVSLQQPLQPGETLLICSDGLHGPVDDDLLAQAASKGSIERAANDLIDLANERGGPDNITAVLARMDAPQTDSWAPDAAPSRHRKAARKAAPAAGTGNARQRALRMLIIALVALVVALGGLTWVVFGMMRDAPDPTPPGDNAGVATWR